ncbi:hypothetical protein GCM10009795_012340 [Nocardioides hankookensis]|uniref:DUF4307 domain-containing protein n=1 Tax=Nocardioides hankookensis TaxID=443157 RepID=A0ABW1LJL7_9ACTN
MNKQRIPGVRDARLPGITARTYGVLTVVILAVAAVTATAVTHLPREDTVDVVDFDLATPAASSCSYDASTRQTTIRTHLDATIRNRTAVALTAGVRDAGTGLPAVTAGRTVDVRGHQTADYTFVVDVPATADPHRCFVEESGDF